MLSSQSSRITQFLTLGLFCLCALLILSFKRNERGSERFKINKPFNLFSSEENLFLGTWKGKGNDLYNYGFANSSKEGYNYDLTFTFSMDSSQSINFNGEFSAILKTSGKTMILGRRIKGTCVKDGDILKGMYTVESENNDKMTGTGVLILQLLPSNKDVNGFYSSRSPVSGALVNGMFTLSKANKM
jgi:hypothetical protein